MKIPNCIKHFFPRRWYAIKNIYYNIKWGFQRMFRGYDDSSTWDLYTAIARLSVPCLKSLIKNRMGFPCGLTDKKWSIILKKILFSMEWVANDYGTEDESIYKHIPKTEVEKKKDLEEKKKYDAEHKNTSLYISDRHLKVNEKKLERMTKKYEEGMQLFAKYFGNLWD